MHDLRRTGSTILNEVGFNGDWIEKCLAHEQGHSSRGVYNKAQDVFRGDGCYLLADANKGSFFMRVISKSNTDGRRWGGGAVRHHKIVG